MIPSFTEEVTALIRSIPEGKVATYGDIASWHKQTPPLILPEIGFLNPRTDRSGR